MEKTILALDCSLRWTNVAVLAEGVSISKQVELGRRQAAGLPSVVEAALSEAGLSFGQIGLLAATNGPGYFTGIRVGASYASALAYALGVRITPVSTLQMLAGSALKQKKQGGDFSSRSPLLVAVYAGRERVYAASFGEDGENKNENLPAGEYGKEAIEKWLLANKGAEIASDDPEKTFLPSLAFLSPDEKGKKILTVRPDASEAARAARENPEAAVTPAEFRASYHRSPL